MLYNPSVFLLYTISSEQKNVVQTLTGQRVTRTATGNGRSVANKLIGMLSFLRWQPKALWLRHGLPA